jgi:hypothetical protein
MTLYATILTIHIGTALSLLVLVAYADHMGFSWMRGKVATLPLSRLRKIHHSVYAGLILMGATGLYMFLPLRSFLLYEPAFIIKMSFLLVLLINSVYIGKLTRVASTAPFALLSTSQRRKLFVSGGVSTICWIGIIVAATQLGV